MTKLLALVEHLLTERSVEVALSAASATYLSSHSLSAVAGSVLVAVGASLGLNLVPAPVAPPKG